MYRQLMKTMKTNKQYEDSARSLTYAFIGIVVMLIIALLTGCGSNKTLTERVVTKVDSTAVVSLQTELSVKEEYYEEVVDEREILKIGNEDICN